MIAKACYVQCDLCGDPAEVSTDGSRLAREYARQQGYIYVKRKDICPRCRTDDGAEAALNRQIVASYR